MAGDDKRRPGRNDAKILKTEKDLGFLLKLGPKELNILVTKEIG